MKFSSTEVFVYALVSTILIFSIIKLNISPKEKIIDPIIARILATKNVREMKDELCDKSSEDLKNFYKEQSSNYTFNPDTEDKFLNDLILKLANGGSLDISKDEIVDYSKDNSVLVVVIILLVILFLFWIPYIICVCSRRCCCIPDSCVENNINSFLIVALVLSVAVDVCCFIGYSQNNDILHGIFGLGCSALKIEQHLVDGDENTKEIPHWMGLNLITESLSKTEEQLKNISQKSQLIQDKKSKIEIEIFPEIESNLTHEYDNMKLKEISSPKPSGGKLKPSYIKNYGPYDNSGTNLYFIYEESKVYKDESIKLLSNIIDVIALNDEKLKEAKDGLGSVSEKLKNAVTKIDDAITSTIGDYYNYFDDVDTYVRKIMNILFSLNLAIAVFFGVSIIFLLCCKCGGVFVCISWFFIYIFMLFSMLLGCVLGVVSAFIKGASSATKYLIQDNIKKINFGEIDVLDSCLNGNGSLSNIGSIKINFDSSIIDNIYNLENNITWVINYIDEHKFETIKESQEKYEFLKKEPHVVTEELENTLVSINNVVGPHGDRWNITKEDCGNDYYPLPNSLRNLLEEDGKNCLAIKEWNENAIRNRYPDGIKDQVANYFNSIKKFIEENNELLEQLEDKNRGFESLLNNMKEHEKEILYDVRDTIKPLRELFEQYINGDSIFDIMNCRFVKRDVNKVIEVLYDEFGGPFKTTSNLFIAISVAEILLTLFVLIIMKGLRLQSTTIPDYSKYSKMNEK